MTVTDRFDNKLKQTTCHHELIACLSSDKISCDLSSCSLTTVPVKELSKEPRLKKLDLSNNRIVSLPKNFILITNLTWLDLSKNLLTSLPENFGSLAKLQHLDLYSNQLKILPLSFGNLQHLKWLDLKNNPLQEGFRKVAGDCLTSKQCEYCANRVTTFMRSMNEKVMEEKKRLKLKQEANEKQEQGLKKQKVETEREQKENSQKKKKKKFKKTGKQNGDKNGTESVTREADQKANYGLFWKIIYVILFPTLIMYLTYTVSKGLKKEDTPQLIINARKFVQDEIVQSLKYLYEFEFEGFYSDMKEFFTSLVS